MNYKSKFTGKQIDDGIDKANSAYQKPQNGIPPKDLSEGVQNSLDKIGALPDHIVTDANYVHTDNNYTTEEKTKLANAITEEQDPTVPQWAKQPTKPSYTPQEVDALPANTPLFDGDYNDLENKPDLSGFITISVNNLANYYLKSETYTKQEVHALIAAIQQFHYEIYASTSVVASPAGNVLYLIGPTGTGPDKYEEYVYDATKQEPWVKIGDTSIDLSGYYTSQQTDAAITSALNTALADYTSTAALTLLLADKEDVTTIVAPVNTTDATLSITTLTTEVGKYYRLDVAVETLTVTLPAIADLTTVRTVVIYLTGGTTPSITISTADSKDVYFQDGFEIEANSTYEINCLFNGVAWIVAAAKINVE